MRDPIDAVEQFLLWFRWGMVAVGIAGLGVGLLSTLAPQRSIALYVWIMARFNWRVSPINEARELRNTRVLGLLLIVLGLVDFWMVWCGRI